MARLVIVSTPRLASLSRCRVVLTWWLPTQLITDRFAICWNSWSRQQGDRQNCVVILARENPRRQPVVRQV